MTATFRNGLLALFGYTWVAVAASVVVGCVGATPAFAVYPGANGTIAVSTQSTTFADGVQLVAPGGGVTTIADVRGGRWTYDGSHLVVAGPPTYEPVFYSADGSSSSDLDSQLPDVPYYSCLLYTSPSPRD